MSTTYERIRVIDAFNRIVAQLNMGYLDISENMADYDEMELIKAAINEYRINYCGDIKEHLMLLDI